jgi:hypothetical protein
MVTSVECLNCGASLSAQPPDTDFVQARHRISQGFPCT